jgi:hypothetical protein
MRGIGFPMVLILALFAVVTGCQDKAAMLERQKAAFGQKTGEIQAEVDKVLQEWHDLMVKSLPEDVKKYPKVKSPLVRWRQDSFDFDWKRPIDAAVVQARQSTVQGKFEAIPEFFETMQKFWAKEVMFKDYHVAYKKMKETADAPLAIMLADFDSAFIHVAAFYDFQDMTEEQQEFFFFRFWQVAFDFPREGQESVGDYMARLCPERLAEFCRDIPFESLNRALEKPYLQEVKRIVDQYLKAHPDEPLNRIFPPFLAEVEARLAVLPDYVEDPVLPASVSKKPWVWNMQFEVSRKGLFVDGPRSEIQLERPRFFDLSKSWKVTPKEWAAFDKAATGFMARFEEDFGVENLELVMVVMDKDATMDIPAGVVETMAKHSPRYLTFGVRRRIEGMARRMALGRLQFREVPLAARKLDVDGVGKVTCRPLGQTNDSQDLITRIGPVVWLDGDTLRTGRLDFERVLEMKDADDAAAVELLRGGAGLVLVSDATTAGRFVTLLDALLVKCGDEKCQFVDDLTPEIEFQVCGR